jgi:AMMECR1 domain-containing protein
VVAAELAGLEIEVSLLSAKAPLYFASEAEALSQLRPGVDGVVLEWRHHRATFLPQMWEVLETPPRFLGELKRKAGLSEKFWHQELRLECYTVRKWSESGRYS